MRELSNDELTEINGGSFGLGKLTLISLGFAFAIGVIDGLFRPLRCR